MFRHILIATDGSRLADKAVRQGIALAESLAAALTCVHVTPPYSEVMDEGYRAPPQAPLRRLYEAESAQRAQKVLAAVARRASAAGVACRTEHVVHAVPHAAIIDTARKRRCDLIAMASHGRSGVQKLLLGSVTTRVLTHSRIPVLVLR